MDFKNFKDSMKNKLINIVSYGADAGEDEKSNIKKNIIMAFGIAVMAMLFIAMVVFFTFKAPKHVELGKGQEIVYVRINPGMGSDAIGKMLLDKGVISSKFKFWLASKLNGADGKFKVGTYAMTRDMSAGEAISVLLHSQTVALRVTIPEGFNVQEIAKRLDEEGLCDEKDFLRLAKTYTPYSYMEKNSVAIYPVEGFLFPDTYEFSTDASAEDIMRRMIDEFDNKLTPEMRSRAAAQNISIYELVTMASLLEKEARYEEDLPIISQVLWKRLSINMPLQSDATLQYVMDEIKEDVSIADTKIDSPYNSYQHYGLPPGPIANPGLNALKAALYPADTDYLYFVADRHGKNYYSHTYDEHLGIVAEVR